MVKMNKEEIAKHLREFMDHNDLTQEEFARLINAPLSSVSNWVRGKRKMSKVWRNTLQDKKVLPEEELKITFKY